MASGTGGKAHNELIQELLEKIQIIEADRQLCREREHALLDLLGTYRNEMLQKFEGFKASPTIPTELTAPETKNTSPTRYNTFPSPLPSSGSSSYSAQFTPGGEIEEAGEDKLIGYILKGLDTLRALLKLATSSKTVALFRTESQEEYNQAAEDSLQRISHLTSNFSTKAAKLHKLCLKSQGVLVPHILDWYMSHAVETLDRFTDEAKAQVPHQHPKELTFRIHGLSQVLADLCKDVLCRGHESEYCIHKFIPGVVDGQEGDIVAVSVVHPGGNWEDIQRYLFAGIKAVTMLDGEIFSLVTLAILKGRWSDEFFDKKLWEEDYQDVCELDVFWLIPDDSTVHDQHFEHPSEADARDIVIDRTRNSVVVSEVGGDYQSGELGQYYDSFSDTDEKPEVSTIILLHELEADSQAQQLGVQVQHNSSSSGTYGEVSKTAIKPAGKADRPSSTARSVGFLSELELQERDCHPYLRAGAGVRVRAPSFISPNRDDKQFMESPPPINPHPFLKRGDGERRRTLLRPSSSPHSWKG